MVYCRRVDTVTLDVTVACGNKERMENTRREESAKHRAADAIVETLVAAGVRTYYGMPGGAISPIYSALGRRDDVRVIHARHETGAVFMAIGQARSGGGPACVLVTSGPGATNALTGLAAAKADGVPVIAIAGEVARKYYGRGALQEGSRYEIDVLGLGQRVCKFAAEICMGTNAVSLTRRALSAAMEGRAGPSLLVLPLDVAEQPSPKGTFGVALPHEPEPEPESLDAAARELAGAERPLLLLGSGARHPVTAAAVQRLVERTGIPVVTSPKGKGIFPESSPACLGVFGYGGHRSATEYLERRPDVVLAVGCGLNDVSTNNWDPALQASSCFIQIEIDPARIGRNYRVDIAFEGAAERVLPALVERVPRVPAPRRWGGVVRELAPPKAGPGLHPASVIECLQNAAPPNTIFATDIGEHTLFAVNGLRTEHLDGFLFGSGLGSMGSGIGAAVGARVAHPSRPVVAVCGDFGFQMYGMELATCVHYRIGVVFVVFNDARMRMVEVGMSRLYQDTVPMIGPPIDFAAMARAIGARGARVHTMDELASAARDLCSSGDDGPAVIDVAIDPTAFFPNNARNRALSNFPHDHAEPSRSAVSG